MRQGTPDQPRRAVAIMAKAARQGQVKTREGLQVTCVEA
jgi:hypothetical protein